jgi:uncharacterized protein (DUF1778 family)
MPAVAQPRARTTTRSERLEARVSPETKALCQKAAELQGSTLTDFLVSSAVEAAKRTMRDHEFVKLTRRDRIAFVEALLDAPAPNSRLRQAAARHAQIFQG